MFPEGFFCDLCVLYFVIKYYYFTQSRKAAKRNRWFFLNAFEEYSVKHGFISTIPEISKTQKKTINRFYFVIGLIYCKIVNAITIRYIWKSSNKSI